MLLLRRAFYRTDVEMSKFVDPRVPAHGLSNDVSALVQLAADYVDLQKQKNVKWFPCHGIPIPTAAAVAELATNREEEIATRKRLQREEDRSRCAAAQTERLAIVPTHKHPLYCDDGDAKPSFAAIAANGIAGRREVFLALEQLCRIVLLRNRVDNRLQRVAKAAARAASSELSGSVDVPRLVLLDMPRLYGTTDAPAVTDAHKEEPSVSDVKQFTAKELRVPFEFKNKAYHQLKFSEHQFTNADLPELVPVLFAGVHEVPPEPAEAPIPAIEHFVQPVVTLETYPLPAFSYVTPEPWRYTIQSQYPQRVCDGGFRPVHISCQYGRLGPSCVVHSDPSSLEVLHAPLPPFMKSARSEDLMSDSEDDVDLLTDLPTGLQQVQLWLPQLETRVPPFPVMSSRHATENSVGSARRLTLASVVKKLHDDLPQEYHLQL